jgi:hypothetical protein
MNWGEICSPLKLTQTETGEYDEENDTKIPDPNRIHQTI